MQNTNPFSIQNSRFQKQDEYQQFQNPFHVQYKFDKKPIYSDNESIQSINTIKSPQQNWQQNSTQNKSILRPQQVYDQQNTPIKKYKPYTKNESNNVSHISQDSQLKFLMIDQHAINHFETISNKSNDEGFPQPQHSSYPQYSHHSQTQNIQPQHIQTQHSQIQYTQPQIIEPQQSQIHSQPQHALPQYSHDVIYQDPLEDYMRARLSSPEYENSPIQPDRNKSLSPQNQNNNLSEKRSNISYKNPIYIQDQQAPTQIQPKQESFIESAMNSQFFPLQTKLPYRQPHGRKPIFLDAIIPEQSDWQEKQKQTQSNLVRMSVNIQNNIIDMEAELALNYDITKFKILQPPNQSEQRLQLNNNPQYIYCVICKEFINSSKIKPHTQTCQKSDKLRVAQSKELILIQLNDRLRKISYLLEQQLKQLRQFSSEQIQIRKLTCYGILIINEIEIGLILKKIQRKNDDLYLVASLMEQHQELNITFILQKALDTVQQKIELILQNNDQ